MKLRDYLDKKRMEQKEFAEITGFSKQKISNFCIGRTIPSIHEAHYMQKLTRGSVKFKDWLLVDDLEIDTVEDKKNEGSGKVDTDTERFVMAPQLTYFKDTLLKKAHDQPCLKCGKN